MCSLCGEEGRQTEPAVAEAGRVNGTTARLDGWSEGSIDCGARKEGPREAPRQARPSWMAEKADTKSTVTTEAPSRHRWTNTARRRQADIWTDRLPDSQTEEERG